LGYTVGGMSNGPLRVVLQKAIRESVLDKDLSLDDGGTLGQAMEEKWRMKEGNGWSSFGAFVSGLQRFIPLSAGGGEGGQGVAPLDAVMTGRCGEEGTTQLELEWVDWQGPVILKDFLKGKVKWNEIRYYSVVFINMNVLL